MKARHCRRICVALTSLSATAFAQSSITLYGVADTSLRYVDAATTHGAAQWSLTNGAITQSRWGLQGRGDLGNELATIFRLESGFNVPNGAGSSTGTLFNRFAYVGLDDKDWGSLTVGQQNNPVYQHLIEGWDPLAVGNYRQNAWLPLAFSGFLRGANNTLAYRFRRGRWSASAAYGFGNIPGNFSGSSMKGISIAYAPNPLGAQAGYTDTRNTAGLAQRVYNLQLRYKLSRTEFWLGYYRSTDQSGAVDAFLNGNTAIASTANPRTDHAIVAGGAHQFSSALRWTHAFYYDCAKNMLAATGSAGSGKRLAFVTLLEYSLSKQATVYATADFNKVTGAATSQLPYKTYQVGAGTGIRSRF